MSKRKEGPVASIGEEEPDQDVLLKKQKLEQNQTYFEERWPSKATKAKLVLQIIDLYEVFCARKYKLRNIVADNIEQNAIQLRVVVLADQANGKNTSKETEDQELDRHIIQSLTAIMSHVWECYYGLEPYVDVTKLNEKERERWDAITKEMRKSDKKNNTDRCLTTVQTMWYEMRSTRLTRRETIADFLDFLSAKSLRKVAMQIKLDTIGSDLQFTPQSPTRYPNGQPNYVTNLTPAERLQLTERMKVVGDLLEQHGLAYHVEVKWEKEDPNVWPKLTLVDDDKKRRKEIDLSEYLTQEGLQKYQTCAAENDREPISRDWIESSPPLREYLQNREMVVVARVLGGELDLTSGRPEMESMIFLKGRGNLPVRVGSDREAIATDLVTGNIRPLEVRMQETRGEGRSSFPRQMENREALERPARRRTMIPYREQPTERANRIRRGLYSDIIIMGEEAERGNRQDAMEEMAMATGPTLSFAMEEVVPLRTARGREQPARQSVPSEDLFHVLGTEEGRRPAISSGRRSTDRETDWAEIHRDQEEFEAQNSGGVARQRHWAELYSDHIARFPFEERRSTGNEPMEIETTSERNPREEAHFAEILHNQDEFEAQNSSEERRRQHWEELLRNHNANFPVREGPSRMNGAERAQRFSEFARSDEEEARQMEIDSATARQPLQIRELGEPMEE